MEINFLNSYYFSTYLIIKSSMNYNNILQFFVNEMMCDVKIPTIPLGYPKGQFRSMDIDIYPEQNIQLTIKITYGNMQPLLICINGEIEIGRVAEILLRFNNIFTYNSQRIFELMNTPNYD